MVAFIVTVQLVENNVNSNVGTEIVVSFRLQYKRFERIWRMNRRRLAARPSHEEPSDCATCCVCVKTDDAAIPVELAMLEMESERLFEPPGTPEMDIFVGMRWSCYRLNCFLSHLIPQRDWTSRD